MTNGTPWPLFTPGKDPVPIVQEAGWAPGSVWTGAENLASTGIRSPDRPARGQSLYRLSNPAHNFWINLIYTYIYVPGNSLLSRLLEAGHFEVKKSLLSLAGNQTQISRSQSPYRLSCPDSCWVCLLVDSDHSQSSSLPATVCSVQQRHVRLNPLNAELNPICCLLALLAHHFLHVSRISVKSLTLRLLMSYIYGAPILDVSRSHTATQHSR